MKYIIITTENRENNKKIFSRYSIGTIYTRGLPDSFKGVINQEGNYKNSPNHETDGWFEFVPKVDGVDYDSSIEVLGSIIFDGGLNIFTNQILTLTDEQIKAKNLAQSASEKELLIKQKLEESVVNSAQTFDDTEALDNSALFPMWDYPFDYPLDFKCQAFSGTSLTLYKCIQAHTSQEIWEPPIVPALFIKVAYPGTIPVWVQPLGAQDAYNIGDQVYYPTINDSVYVSLIDANTFSPDAFPAGWQIV